MSPASREAVAAQLRAMGCPSSHAERLIAGRPLVSVSPALAVVALAEGPRMRPTVMRPGPVPMPAPGCWWSASNRALVVEAIATGQATVDAVVDHYPDVTRQDVEGWIRAASSDAQRRGCDRARAA